MGCQICKIEQSSQNKQTIGLRDGYSKSLGVGNVERGDDKKLSELPILKEASLNKTLLDKKVVIQGHKERPKIFKEELSPSHPTNLISGRPNLSQRSTRVKFWPEEERKLSKNSMSYKNRSVSLSRLKKRFFNFRVDHSHSHSFQNFKILKNGKCINDSIIVSRKNISLENTNKQRNEKPPKISLAPVDLPNRKKYNIDLLKPVKTRFKNRRISSRIENQTRLLEGKKLEYGRSHFVKGPNLSPPVDSKNKIMILNDKYYGSRESNQGFQIPDSYKMQKIGWKSLKNIQGNQKYFYFKPLVHSNKKISPSSSFNIRTAFNTKLSFSQQYSWLNLQEKHTLQKTYSKRTIASPCIMRRLHTRKSNEQEIKRRQLSLNCTPKLQKTCLRNNFNSGSKTTSAKSSNKWQVDYSKRMFLFKINSCTSSSSTSSSSNSHSIALNTST